MTTQRIAYEAPDVEDYGSISQHTFWLNFPYNPTPPDHNISQSPPCDYTKQTW